MLTKLKIARADYADAQASLRLNAECLNIRRLSLNGAILSPRCFAAFDFLTSLDRIK